MILLLEIFKTIKERSLFPIVPIFNNNNFPSVPWKDNKNHIDTIEKLESQGEYFEYVNKKGETKTGKITGAALLTGKMSGIMILDLDRNHGDNCADGLVNYKELVDGLNLSEDDKNKAFNTFTVKTPNGGLHLYFQYREGLKSDSNKDLSIDVKTDGGLIVLPGSLRRLKDGKIKNYEIYKDNHIEDIPEALFQELLKKFSKEKQQKQQNKKKSNEATNINQDGYYVVKNEGERDISLFKYLCKMIKFIKDPTELFELGKMYNQCYLNPPLEDNVVNQKVEQALGYVIKPYCNDKGKIIEGSLVKYILENNPSYVKGTMLYMYDDKEGIYKYKDDKDLQELYYESIINDEDIKDAKARSFVKTIFGVTKRYIDTFDYENRYIACKNGIIDSINGNLLEFNPKYKLDCKFNANYIKDKEEYIDKFNNSKFKKFLEDILDKDTIITLQEAWGTILCPNSTKVQRCFIYKGEGSNGKSSLFDIQEALLMDKDRSICGISLGAFEKEFILSMAEGKRLNIVRDDVFDYKNTQALFKSCVCGEDVTVNRKNKDYARMRFNIAWFYGLNKMPITQDKSFGFFRRPVLIPFNVRFGSQKDVLEGKADKEAIPGIVEDIIKNEMDIIFNWAYEGLQKLISNKWKITESQEIIKEMENYREESDSVYKFYKERLVKTSGSKILASSLYTSYENYCKSEKINPVNTINFGRQIESFGHKKYKSGGSKVFKDLDYIKFFPASDNEMPF